jgi:predicted O-methyltransferase YrrM
MPIVTFRAPVDTLERLLQEGPPLACDAWSLADAPLRLVLTAIDSGARAVIECGSGRSTVVIARRLAELGEGSVHSLEHDPAWAERTSAQLRAESLECATVIAAPLEPHALAGEGGGWYSRAELAKLPEEFDLLLVDGPPAGEPQLRRSRHPALAELSGRLRPGALVVIDDASRAGESQAIEIWSRDFGLEFELSSDHGFAAAQLPPVWSADG